MDNFIFKAVILLIGMMFIFMALATASVKQYARRGTRLIASFATTLIVIGGLGFFGTAFSAVGGFNWLPLSFEWPAGYVADVVSLPSGEHIVPHKASGRVQVYDYEWRFLRGWHVDAGGGTFKIIPADSNRIEVVTARGDWRYTYTLDGSLIARAKYLPSNYSSFPDHGTPEIVPTLPWLWVFTSPFISIAVIAIGGVVQNLLARQPKRKIIP